MTEVIETLNRRYGYKRDLPDIRDHQFGFVGDPNTLPASVDLRQFEGGIFDQGQLGSCTGNAIAKAIQIWMHKNNYPYKFTPSRLQIYFDERALEGTTDSDSGAEIRDGFKVINTNGVCPEDSNHEWSWPYSSSDDRFKQKPPQACYDDAKLHKCLTYQRVNQDENSVKAALASGMPLVIGIAVYPSFETAKKGVIPMPGFLDRLRGPLGGHALCVSGYGILDPDHVTGPNSWGADWGDEGHFHLPFKYLLNPQLCSDIWALGMTT